MAISKGLAQILFNSRQLYQQSEEMAKRAEKQLQDLRKVLKAEIVAASGDDLANSVGVQSAQRLLQQVNLQIAAAVRSLERDATDMMKKAYQEQYREALKEIEAIEQTVKAGVFDAATMQAVEGLQPRLTGLLYRSTLEGVGHAVKAIPTVLQDEIRRIVTVGAIRSETFGAMANKIVGSGLTLDGIKPGVFKSVEDRAKAIVITQTTEIYNTARFESIERINQTVDPDKQLSFKWVAVLDKRTSDICRHLNGQVQPQGKDFQYGRFKGAKPPAHPRCRSTIVAYHEEWKDIFDELDKELAKIA